MAPIQTDNLRITELRPLPAPADLAHEIPRDDTVSQTVTQCRQAVRDILAGRDDRLLVVVGPCSIHDPKSALDYAIA